MIHRRKAATYGKSSRKPISDFSAFAQASEQTTEHGRQNYNTTTTPKTQDVGVKLLQRSGALKPLPKTKEAVSSELQGRTGSGTGITQSKDELYDFPSTDEDIGRSISTSDTGSRKRRKFSPKNDDSPTLVVFDDDSLQRHIAAEVQKESAMAASATRKAVAIPKPWMTYTQGTLEVSKQNTNMPVNNRGRTSVIPSVPNAARSAKRPEATIPIAKNDASPKNQDKRVSRPRTPPLKTKGTNKSLAQHTRDSYMSPVDDFLPVLPARGRLESKHSEREQDFPPSTPSRPCSSAGVATTPKQQELWGKLLFNDTQSASPSLLDLPGLRIAEQQEQPQNPTSKSQILIRGKAANMGNGKRSARLVDFLTTSDGDRSASESESSEENESSGAEQSKSIRSEVSINDDILTMQTSPSTGSQSRRLQPQDPRLAPISQPILSLQGVPKVTYIRERTHLGDNDIHDAAMIDVPLVPAIGISRNRQWGASGVVQAKHESSKDVFDGLDGVQDSQGGTMRSIHELREAGGNTRLVGELEAILDDLDQRLDSSISARRSALMSLTFKLLEASTCCMFVDQGLEPRLLVQVNFGHDVIERSLLVASILQILFHTTSAVFLSQINQVRTTNLLIGLLDHTQDLTKQAKLRETNMSKSAQSEYTTLCASFLRSPVWRALKPPVLSGQILALQCLDLLVRQAREAGSLAEILSADAISRIAETSLPSPGELQPPRGCSKVCLELAVSVLESSTISGAAENRDAEWTDTTLERISAISSMLADAPSHEFGSLWTLTLRLYLNLTNTNPHLCDTFSKPHVVSAVLKTMLLQFGRLSQAESEHQGQHVLDNLVLSLGCLINLAESSDTMRRLVMDLRTDKHSFLEMLLQLFIRKRRKAAEAYSEEEAGNNVAFGYLSVLLCYLCINRAVRSQVNARVEGPTLDALLDAVDEFLQYHRQIDDGTQRENEDRDRRANFVSRLQGTIDDLRTSG